LLKRIPGGSDPEEFAVSPDGSKLYVANEDAGQASIVDIASGQIFKSLPGR
jgi:DNA-binding beta-propeller fold protein YncE